MEREEATLSPYAAKSAQTKGRVHAEEEHPFRGPFQRDRDRIIHCHAFRRLEYKTQVFACITRATTTGRALRTQ
jgi:dGTPase